MNNARKNASAKDGTSVVSSSDQATLDSSAQGLDTTSLNDSSLDGLAK